MGALGGHATHCNHLLATGGGHPGPEQAPRRTDLKAPQTPRLTPPGPALNTPLAWKPHSGLCLAARTARRTARGSRDAPLKSASPSSGLCGRTGSTWNI